MNKPASVSNRIPPNRRGCILQHLCFFSCGEGCWPKPFWDLGAECRQSRKDACTLYAHNIDVRINIIDTKNKPKRILHTNTHININISMNIDTNAEKLIRIHHIWILALERVMGQLDVCTKPLMSPGPLPEVSTGTHGAAIHFGIVFKCLFL